MACKFTRGAFTLGRQVAFVCHLSNVNIQSFDDRNSLSKLTDSTRCKHCRATRSPSGNNGRLNKFQFQHVGSSALPRSARFRNVRIIYCVCAQTSIFRDLMILWQRRQSTQCKLHRPRRVCQPNSFLLQGEIVCRMCRYAITGLKLN